MNCPSAPEADASTPFHRVSPKLAKAKITAAIVVVLPLLAVLVAVALLFDLPSWLLVALAFAAIVGTGWYAYIALRQVAAMGYQCRENDLRIEHGIMLRRSTLVPYGRMQFVEVSQGPIARKFGLATVELHTAAALSEASIDGLPRDEADALRDLLAARGESNLAGL